MKTCLWKHGHMIRTLLDYDYDAAMLLKKEASKKEYSVDPPVWDPVIKMLKIVFIWDLENISLSLSLWFSNIESVIRYWRGVAQEIARMLVLCPFSTQIITPLVEIATWLPNPNPSPTPNLKPTNTRGVIIWRGSEFATTLVKGLYMQWI